MQTQIRLLLRKQSDPGSSLFAFWTSILWVPAKITNIWEQKEKLEDLKRSPDLLYNVKVGHGQLRLIIQTYFVLPYMGMVAILV